MNNKIWKAKAPANIALIKYMGKEGGNVPYNVSLSYTLEDLYTEVSLRLIANSTKENKDSFVNPDFSEAEVGRFLKHLNRIKNILNFKDCFIVTSHNSFPKSAGIASSASSFAALTTCAFKAISDIRNTQLPSKEFMSEVSRIGSGSSCRSFFSPWCIWKIEDGVSVVEKLEIPFELDHQLVLVDTKTKKVSSSEAHQRVKTSLLMGGRAERANARCQRLLRALKNEKWDESYQVCWEDFWDMHALFETSNPSFGYMLPKTLEILRKVHSFWEKNGDGPIATVDAGPNVHLLWRKDNKEMVEKFAEYCAA